MDVQSFMIGLLTGVVFFAFLPFAVLLLVAVVEILLTPSVAHAPEINHDAEATREELLRAKEEVDRLITEGETYLSGGK